MTRLTPEKEARWEQVWKEASEFEQRRYERLERRDKLYVMALVPTGVAATRTRNVAHPARTQAAIRFRRIFMGEEGARRPQAL